MAQNLGLVAGWVRSETAPVNADGSPRTEPLWAKIRANDITKYDIYYFDSDVGTSGEWVDLFAKITTIADEQGASAATAALAPLLDPNNDGVINTLNEIISALNGAPEGVGSILTLINAKEDSFTKNSAFNKDFGHNDFEVPHAGKTIHYIGEVGGTIPLESPELFKTGFYEIDEPRTSVYPISGHKGMLYVGAPINHDNDSGWIREYRYISYSDDNAGGQEWFKARRPFAGSSTWHRVIYSSEINDYLTTSSAQATYVRKSNFELKHQITFDTSDVSYIVIGDNTQFGGGHSPATSAPLVFSNNVIVSIQVEDTAGEISALKVGLVPVYLDKS